MPPLLLLKDKQIQTGAEWDSVIGFSVVILILSAFAVLVALAVSRTLHGRRRRSDARSRHGHGRRRLSKSGEGSGK